MPTKSRCFEPAFQKENPLQTRPGAGFAGVKCSYPG